MSGHRLSGPMFVFFAVILAVSSAGTTVWSQATNPGINGQPPQNDHRPGAKVELDWGGKSVTAEIVEQTRPGFYKVKFDWNGKEQSPTVPAANLRPVSSPSQKSQVSRKWKDASGKFELE